MASALIPIGLGLGSFLGGLFGHKNKSQTQTNTNQTSMPFTLPQFAPLQQALLGSIMKRLQTGTDTRALEAQGIGKANQVFRNIAAGQEAGLTGRGLESSPVAAAVEGTREAQRGGSIVDWLNQVPQIAREQQGQDLGLGEMLLRMGMGTKTTGTSTGTGTETAGGGLGGGLEGLASILGWLYGMGKLGGGSPAAGGGGGIFGGGGASGGWG